MFSLQRNSGDSGREKGGTKMFLDGSLNQLGIKQVVGGTPFVKSLSSSTKMRNLSRWFATLKYSLLCISSGYRTTTYSLVTFAINYNKVGERTWRLKDNA
jgi:hypothetical protein